jgi:hypothetical protein
MILLEQKIDPKRLFRGAQHFWDVMQKLTRENGTFTRQDVEGQSGGYEKRNVADWTKRWLKSGHIQQLNDEPPFIYKVTKFSRRFPSADRKGKVKPRGTQQIWNAVRQLKIFTLDDLRFAASTDDYQPTAATVRTYIQRLARAGFFAVRRGNNGKIKHVYRLKARFDVGPDAPRILRTKVVYDPNAQCTIGEPEIETEE